MAETEPRGIDQWRVLQTTQRGVGLPLSKCRKFVHLLDQALHAVIEHKVGAGLGCTHAIDRDGVDHSTRSYVGLRLLEMIDRLGSRRHRSNLPCLPPCPATPSRWTRSSYASH